MLRGLPKPPKMGYKAPMDTNTDKNIDMPSEPQLMDVMDHLGVTELGPEVLKSAMLGQDLLSEAMSVLDSPQEDSKKPIH